jgi:signal transduction histidine kinase
VKFVLVLFFGAILPLGLVGLWLAHTAARSGEDLLRTRLEQTLGRTVEQIGRQWIRTRSNLIDIAEHPLVQAQLGPEVRPPFAPERSGWDELRAIYADFQHDIARITVRDLAGAEHLSLAPDQGYAAGAGLIAPVFPVELTIHEPTTGRSLGTLEAEIRMSSLLPNGAEWGAVGGVLAAFDRATGTSLIPLSIDPNLFREGEVEWGGERWVSVRQLLSEPSLELVLAAPVGPFEQPFAQATRRGTLALALVAVVSFVLVTVVTTGITGSLRRLAVAADAVSQGEFDRKVSEAGGDELARVARAFNTMTENLRRTLEQLSQRQSLAAVGEFAASLAHEVRNPLSSILVDLQRVDEKLTAPRERELVRRALRSVKRLDATVTGALRVARSGHVSPQHLDLRPVLEAAMQSAQPEFASCGSRLEPLGDEADGVSVKGDAAALEQVFLNLLLNAAQAQESGGRAGVRIDTDDAHVRLAIWDDGPGIPPEDRTKVLDPFYSTKEEGTGLGLAIAQRIVAAHGGELDVQSTPGGGTTVHVRLPLAPGTSDVAVTD